MEGGLGIGGEYGIYCDNEFTIKDMTNPKVSVIMGIYNCAPYLQEALDSLYSQTFQDFEIILCDDGSKDNTYELAFENQKRHPNIVLLRNPFNMGLNQTLNNCLSVARGNYIARMDGDDICMSNRFEVEVKYLDVHPEYAIVSSPMEYFDEEGVFRVGKGKGEIKKKDFLLGSPICHAPCMVRKDAYDKVGGYSVGKRLLRVEDYHLWFKMYAVGYKAYMLERPYYCMRDDHKAKARRTFRNRINEFLVKCKGFKMLGLPIWSYIFAIQPLVMAILPNIIYSRIHGK